MCTGRSQPFWGASPWQSFWCARLANPPGSVPPDLFNQDETASQSIRWRGTGEAHCRLSNWPECLLRMSQFCVAVDGVMESPLLVLRPVPIRVVRPFYIRCLLEAQLLLAKAACRHEHEDSMQRKTTWDVAKELLPLF